MTGEQRDQMRELLNNFLDDLHNATELARSLAEGTPEYDRAKRLARQAARHAITCTEFLYPGPPQAVIYQLCNARAAERTGRLQ